MPERAGHRANEVARPARAPSKWARPAVWAALVLVSFPILIDYGRHVAASSWAMYALVFPPLTWIAVRSDPPGRRYGALALVILTLGISIEAVALTSGTLRLGRIGFVLCVAAILMQEGRLPFRAMVLLALCVPLPHGILERSAGGMLHALTLGLASFSRWSGTPAIVQGAGIDRPSGFMVLDAVDVGWTAGLLAFGLVWFVGTRRGITIGQAIGLSLAGGLLGLVVQTIATLGLFHFAGSSDLTVLRWIRDGLVYAVIGLGVLVGFRASRLRANAS